MDYIEPGTQPRKEESTFTDRRRSTMPDPAQKAELMRSLRRLVRGLSALFWGLPLTLMVCVRTSVSEWLRPLGIVPPLLTTGLLLYALWELGHFQKQERVWILTLDRAKFLAIINVGLSPFVFWWNQLPHVTFYFLGVSILMLSGLLFLFNLNLVLQRLAAMLPDETLKVETRFFSSINLYLLFSVLALVTLYVILMQITTLPALLSHLVRAVADDRQWLFVFLILLPLAMTMTMIWKIKEAVLASVFNDSD
jgi:hypothetical protein